MTLPPLPALVREIENCITARHLDAALALCSNLRAAIAAVPAQPSYQHSPRDDYESGDSFAGMCESAQPVQPVQQPGAEFDHSIGADRFTVRRGSFWWHVRIGGSTSNVGKFHTKLAAEDMALKMLTAYRDGAFEQYQAARAHAAPAQRQPLPPGLRLAAAFTRADLGPDGSNYPHVRELLAFAEQALGITAAPEAQKGEKL